MFSSPFSNSSISNLSSSNSNQINFFKYHILKFITQNGTSTTTPRVPRLRTYRQVPQIHTKARWPRPRTNNRRRRGGQHPKRSAQQIRSSRGERHNPIPPIRNSLRPRQKLLRRTTCKTNIRIQHRRPRKVFVIHKSRVDDLGSNGETQHPYRRIGPRHRTLPNRTSPPERRGNPQRRETTLDASNGSNPRPWKTPLLLRRRRSMGRRRRHIPRRLRLLPKDYPPLHILSKPRFHPPHLQHRTRHLHPRLRSLKCHVIMGSRRVSIPRCQEPEYVAGRGISDDSVSLFLPVASGGGL